MGVIQSFERRLQGAVGNTFARMFGGTVQPAEVADALQREVADHVHHQGNRTIAPNSFRVRLGPTDREVLGADEASVGSALSDMIREYLDEQGYQTFGDVSVTLEQSDSLHTGQFRISSIVDPDVDRRSRDSRAGVGRMTQQPGDPNRDPNRDPQREPSDRGRATRASGDQQYGRRLPAVRPAARVPAALRRPRLPARPATHPATASSPGNRDSRGSSSPYGPPPQGYPHRRTPATGPARPAGTPAVGTGLPPAAPARAGPVGPARPELPAAVRPAVRTELRHRTTRSSTAPRNRTSSRRCPSTTAPAAATSCSAARTWSVAARTPPSGCRTPRCPAVMSTSTSTASRPCCTTSAPPTAPPSTAPPSRPGSSPTAT